MTPRQAWLVIAVFVALTVWLLVGAVTTITSDTGRMTPATASEPVIYTEEP